MSEANKATIKRFWEEVFNGRNLALVDDLFVEDYVHHGARGQEFAGREALKQDLGRYFSAFPDLRVDVEDVFAEGDRVASRVAGQGTHNGELMGIPPTGRKAAASVMCISRFVGNRVAENWELVDLFGMMMQLGVIQPPGRS